MRILHILDHSIPLHSGYTFRTRSILVQQHAMGWETYHLTSPKHTLACAPEEDVDGLHFYRTAATSSKLAKLPVVEYLHLMLVLKRRMLEVAAKIRPDILHAHSPVLNAIPAIAVGKLLGIPVVYEVRAFWEDAAADHGTSREGGLRYRLTRALETYAFRHVHAITTICEGLRRDIVARGIPEEKVTVVPNAVDIEKFSISSARDSALAKSLGVNDMRVLGFIGSFYSYEGLPLLLRALPSILKQCPDVRVLLVGGGPDEGRLRKLVEELDISDKVIFTGRIPHEEVPRYYDLVDIFVYPRYPMRLTDLVTPLKPLEAMARGRLVVASDVGGHSELVQNNKTGVLFRAGDVGSLTEKIVSLLADPSRWAAIQASARRYVETERNWPVCVARYRPVYMRLSANAGKQG